MHVTPTAVARGPRAMVVVDGSDRSWRALAWAVGYARSRRISALEIVAYPGPWHHFPDAGQLCALMATDFPRVDPESVRQSILSTARTLCAEDGLDITVTRGRCDSSRDLARLAERERPDLVVMSRFGSLSKMATRKVVSRLMRNGIPVTIVP